MAKLGPFPLSVIPFILAAIIPALQVNGMPRAADRAGAQGNILAPPLSDWRPVVSGRLKNGVRFAILPRRGHEPGVALLLRNEGGFIAEHRPGERGLAHLIEHVAFLSPTIAKPDDLHHLIHEGRGITFPAPSAGTTSWRETNYFLSTKTTDIAAIDKLLGVFREITTDLTFRRDAVDEGRAQVIQEMAGRKLGNDIYANYIAAVAPGSPNDIINAQNSDDVPTASIDMIRRLYRQLYQPANMMVVVVGNVDTAQVRALIQKRFGGWKGVEHDASAPAPIFRSDRIAPISFAAPQQGRQSVIATVVMPTPRPPTSRDRQAAAMLMDLLEVRAVDNRLTRAQPDSPPGKTGMFIENGEQGHRQIMLWDNFVADLWRPAVASLQRTTCDLRTTGFSDGEWAAAKQDVFRTLQQRAGAMSEVSNVELAKDLSHAIAANRDLIPPDALLRYARSSLPAINARAGNRWWQRQWRANIQHLRVETPVLAQIDKPISVIRTTADQAVDNPICKMRR